MPSSMKTRQARDKLRKINPTWFDNFFKNDLKKLTQKNATANEVIRYAEDEKSNIYAYAQNLIYSVDLGGNSMTDFKTAIELQSKSWGTKHEGLFYKLIVSQRSELTNLKSNPEKPGKLPQIKSKIKAFLLATNEKEKDIIDEDVSEEDKKFKRMNNSSIIQKLKSSRLSNVLKVFMALVFWDCIKIVEKEIKSKKEQAEEEAKRKAQESAEQKRQRQTREAAEQERQHQEQEAAEQERQRKEQERQRQEQEQKDAYEAAKAKFKAKEGEIEAFRKKKKEDEEKEEKERQEFQKQIVSERPKHDKFVETVGKLYDIGRDDGKAQEITDLYNSLEFEQIDEPEYYFFNTDALYNIKELAAKKKADAKSVKKFVGELLWLRYLEVFQKPKKERYDRLERIEYIFKGFYRGPGKSDSKYTLEYLEDMAKTYGNRFNKLAETIHLLRSQRGILGKTNSLNKMRNVLVTLEKLNETLESLKSDDLLKILAESLQKMQIEPLINEVKQKMEAREKKEKESPKKKFPYTAKPGSELDGASEDGRYVPYISGSTGKEKIAGEGGYGTVGIYWDTQEKCKVAIKTKRDETIFGSKITDLPQIKSPYVAALKDLTTLIIDGQKVPGLVMEYVHGQTCFMDQIYRLSPEKLLETCKQLIDAFEAFAKAGVHQWDLDQHFQNVRIDKNGNIKIIDYDDASTGGGYNRVYATTYVIAALSAYRNGDELREKFLEQFPELDGQVKEDDYTPYMYKVSDNVPTFGELRVALDRLKEQKVFG